MFNALFHLMGELLCYFAAEHLHELRSLFVQVAVGVAGDQLVQIVRDRSDIFRNRPFIVVQNNEKPFGGISYIVECLVTYAASEGGVPRDDYNIFFPASTIPGDGHSQSRRERGSCGAGAVTAVFAFGAKQESVQSLAFPHAFHPASSPAHTIMHISLL